MAEETLLQGEGPQICVAIPLRTGTLRSIANSVRDSIKKGATLIEFRIDYYNMPTKIPVEFLRKLVELVPVPIILTMRDSKEGGKTNLSGEERIKIVKRLIESQPDYVDVEATTDVDVLIDLYELAQKNGVGLIYSHHNFKKTPDLNDLRQLSQEIIAKCPGLEYSKGVKELTRKECILKMVFFARKMEDNLSLFTLCKEITQKGINISTFCMGVRGMLSRVFCVKYGSAYTYASIGEKTAPGQVSISEFVQLYKKGEESLQKKIEDKYKRK